MPELPKLKIEEVLIVSGLAKSHRSAEPQPKFRRRFSQTSADQKQNLAAKERSVAEPQPNPKTKTKPTTAWRHGEDQNLLPLIFADQR
jgi:hypothetical protein